MDEDSDSSLSQFEDDDEADDEVNQSNPWDLDKLLSEDHETKDMSLWKKYARIILPHVGLILISCVYIVGGAMIFYVVESPNEVNIRRENLYLINKQKEEMLRSLWNEMKANNLSREEVNMLAMSYIDESTRILFDAFDTHFITGVHLRNKSAVENSWTVTTAIFFTTTLLTTIGYGNQAPVTTHGRLICIFYALFGVPLILITVADIGKFLSENIIWLYSMYTDRCKKNKDNYQLQTEAEDEEKKELAQLGLEHYITIPIMLIATILLGYMMVGAILLARWERWSFFEGFYFSFITMTTVGFGDIVPLKQEFFMFDLFYIIVGLAITTMCIDLAGLQYIRKIHYFGRAIKDARFALVNVGGKMVHVSDLMKYAQVLQQKYGQSKGTMVIKRGAYVPSDIAIIRYIDYSNIGSLNSLISLVSSVFSKTSEPKML
ncbi:unnamed protein product [Bursaphelenchus okinawaensis]|uniref:Potassium channel domain-containing protein n=1 Tax=Bursaphelenchus okinawaensis TaxID=465554 RepID=A0A811KJK5_9BILA|nr:unnamed protein product [Bursaphelenchus okinawaensis]CAG9105056.1 unnamed protein product [Bursaphelenchus okinawaensis]